MGASTSTLTPEQKRKVAWSMPAYCIEDYSVTQATTQLVNASWEYLMSGSSPPFLLATASEPSLAPVTFFYDRFYTFLFELVPECKPLFKHGLEAQGRMLASLIKFIIAPDIAILETSDGTSDQVLIASLQHLARVHNRIGISAGSYSIMGIVLIHTIRSCVGESYWTPELHNAWVQVFSKICAIMIPVVVANEMPHGVRPVGVCPASGAAGENPHLPRKTSSTTISPVDPPPKKTGKVEPVYDYRQAAANMVLHEPLSSPHSMKGVASNAPLARTSSNRVGEAPFTKSVAPIAADAGPHFIQPDEIGRSRRGMEDFSIDGEKLQGINTPNAQ